MITEIKKSRLQRLLISVIFFGIFVILFSSSSSRAEIIGDWIMTKGHFCTLYINQNVDIAALNRRINTYNVDFGLTEKPAHLGREPEAEVLYKFDLVFLKVRELLDMRPPKIRLNVKIYKNKEEIDTVYLEIFNEKNQFIAFYIFTLNTLFACEEKISASVVAHEIAHCIIDHHFTVPPPKKIAEMIAHYAELHLRE